MLKSFPAVWMSASSLETSVSKTKWFHNTEVADLATERTPAVYATCWYKQRNKSCFSHFRVSFHFRENVEHLTFFYHLENAPPPHHHRDLPSTVLPCFISKTKQIIDNKHLRVRKDYVKQTNKRTNKKRIKWFQKSHLSLRVRVQNKRIF